MFRHRGKSRTLVHNLKLASLLSFVAGLVNVSGLLAVQRLTTNVTGHFGFFAEEMSKENFAAALVFLLFIFFFLFGAFCSNTIVELVSGFNVRFMNTVPVAVEITVLTCIGFLEPQVIVSNANVIACLLLFAMGMQNALVTSLSNSVVRTTHLTGLFTDLGIELSQLLFYKRTMQQKKLVSSIKLRLTIIFFFFIGGVAGGWGYRLLNIKILLPAAVILFVALIYDSVKLKLVTIKRKYEQRWGE